MSHTDCHRQRAIGTIWRRVTAAAGYQSFSSCGPAAMGAGVASIVPQIYSTLLYQCTFLYFTECSFTALHHMSPIFAALCTSLLWRLICPPVICYGQGGSTCFIKVLSQKIFHISKFSTCLIKVLFNKIFYVSIYQ